MWMTYCRNWFVKTKILLVSTAATSCKYYYVMIHRLFVFKMSKKMKNCSSQNPKDFIFSVINDKDKQKILSHEAEPANVSHFCFKMTEDYQIWSLIVFLIDCSDLEVWHCVCLICEGEESNTKTHTHSNTTWWLYEVDYSSDSVSSGRKDP